MDGRHAEPPVPDGKTKFARLNVAFFSVEICPGAC